VRFRELDNNTGKEEILLMAWWFTGSYDMLEFAG
jgi:hypothetical protein